MQALAGRLRKGVGIALAVGTLAPATASADQLLTADEAIIQNSTCIGTQCTTDESFGFDTLRLREDNLRLDFMDTSNPAGDRASTDWRLVANESEANGDDVFEIQDAGDDGGLQDSVFRLFAGAPANAMVLDPEGDLGLGTDGPGLDLHLTETDTPGIRLEQTASPFAAQTWDVAGNEANFFVRDLTGGSSLPFRIRPGAPTSSIDIGGDGDVGIGDSSPEARLDVNGDVRTEGAIAQLSDADAKNSVTPVDPADILRKVNALPISTWKYDDDASGQTHLGPMAQDFYARFGVGVEKYVSLQDLAGVSLAANQALSQQADGLDNRVGALGSRVGDLDSRVGALEGAGPGAPDLTPRVDELESSLAKANKQIKKLNKRVKKLAKR